jgi:type VI secretion system protein ImpG
MIDKYYEEELRYLYESGREFARAHPDRERFLNVDAVGDRDPYVERLFEGFAFLTARIREKLDDAFPELTEGLINLLWPQFAHEFPSAAIVQLRPRPGFLHETRLLPRGSEVLSAPVGPESTPCRFITTQDVRLNPVSLQSAAVSADGRGNSVITLRFRIDDRVSWENLSLSPIRLFLHAERPAALTLREFFTSRIMRAVLTIDDGRREVECPPDTVCTAAGFSTDESLLPDGHGRFDATAVLLEYCTYPEKFMFIDLLGWDRAAPGDGGMQTLTYTLTFSGDLGPDVRVGADSFRLFCSPVINLYRASIEPVNNTGKQEEYRLVADASRPSSCLVHSVIGVEGIDRITGRRSRYEPLYAFYGTGQHGTRTFSTRRIRAADGSRQMQICFSGEALDGTGLHEQSCSIEAWCTNGALAREEIPEGGINRGGRDFPDYVMVSNITRPTLPCSPPDSGEYIWTFLSHQASNYLSLASPDILRSVLSLYNWAPDEGVAKRISSICDVSALPAEKPAGPGLVRGVTFEISVTASHFESDGDIRLFGEVCARFLSQYVSINSFLDCVLVLKPSSRRVVVSSPAGTQWLI